ncbi:MAG: hypothetical protein AAB478_03155 [Patescibacteria group bacterium]
MIAPESLRQMLPQMREVARLVNEDLPILLGDQLGEGITVDEIDDIAGLERAVFCLEQMRLVGTYCGERLGVMNEKASQNLLGKFHPGEVIIFEDPEKGKTVVYQPYQQDYIRERRSGYIFSSITVNVEAGLVRPVVIEAVSEAR